MLEKTLILSDYGEETDEVRYYSRGPLYQLLQKKLAIKQMNAKEKYNGESLRQRGADITIGLDVAGREREVIGIDLFFTISQDQEAEIADKIWQQRKVWQENNG